MKLNTNPKFVILAVLTVIGVLVATRTFADRRAPGRPFEFLRRASPSYENEFLKVVPSSSITGIIDLFYKTPNEDWKQYNNIVPIAKVGGVWGNAEIDKATISQNVVSQTDNETIVKYQFSPLPNGAHFYLLMTLTKGEQKVKFQAVLNDDSKPVEALALGNYYGLANTVRYIKINGTTYDALSFPKPNPDGNGQMGTFIRLETPSDNNVTFWGENYDKQYQHIDAPLSGQDEVVAEIRFTPWLQSQPAPGKNWFETVHITRSPFTPSKSVWYFGRDVDSPKPSPSPTSTPASTPTPTPTPTPSPDWYSKCLDSDCGQFSSPRSKDGVGSKEQSTPPSNFDYYNNFPF